MSYLSAALSCELTKAGRSSDSDFFRNIVVLRDREEWSLKQATNESHLGIGEKRIKSLGHSKKKKISICILQLISRNKSSFRWNKQTMEVLPPCWISTRGHVSTNQTFFAGEGMLKQKCSARAQFGVCWILGETHNGCSLFPQNKLKYI